MLFIYLYITFRYNNAGAVLCAKNDCDHLDCHGGPFLVVFVGMIYDNDADDDKDLHTWALGKHVLVKGRCPECLTNPMT
jgi:hypothetical protein